MTRLVSVACVFVVALGTSYGSCAGQEAKADAKKTPSGAKPGATVGSAATLTAAKAWTPAELGGTREPYAEITLAPTGKPLLAIPNYARNNRGGRSIVWIKEG